MHQVHKRSSWAVILNALGWPVLWGSLATLVFYLLLHYDVIHSGLARRYFMAHPVEYVECLLFFIGVCALLLKAMHVLGQFHSLSDIELPTKPPGGLVMAQVQDLAESLAQMPRRVRDSYFVRRMITALQHVARKGSSAGLEQELKHYGELDALRQYEGYALVRIIIWATPMLGFLGTVIGITLALGDLSPQSLVATPERAMEGLLGGLSVAFDTTALALALSMLLMFLQFVTNRLETDLLEAVDARAERELIGRFADATMSLALSDDTLDGFQRSMQRSVETLARHQAEIWRAAVDGTQRQWQQMTQDSGRLIEHGLERALQATMQSHGQELARQELQAESRTERRWEQFQTVLAQNAQVMQAQQAELVRQGDLIVQALQSSAGLAACQQQLGEQLQRLTGSGSMDEAIRSLSTAIQRLHLRLGAESASPPTVPMRSTRQEAAGRRAVA